MSIIPKVKGYCPVCGRDDLILGLGGYVTCGYIPCPDPTNVSDLLEDRVTWHTVTITEPTFWNVLHPLKERRGGAYAICGIGEWLANTDTESPIASGLYRADPTMIGTWILTKIS